MNESNRTSGINRIPSCFTDIEKARMLVAKIPIFKSLILKKRRKAVNVSKIKKADTMSGSIFL